MLAKKYFPDFSHKLVDVGDGIKINTFVGGQGKEAILLLHGHPETCIMWRFIAPKLAEKFTVVLTDLRGYGDSTKPQGLPDHSNYSKRVMANDQVVVMEQLGFSRFHLAGHDRGARVCHRLLLDHPEKVLTCTLMDILPTYDMYRDTNQEFATKYWHWFFYIQPDGFPEKLLSADPEFFIHFNLQRKIGPKARERFSEEVLQEYTRCFSDPMTIHGISEDYRASATIDMEYDLLDRDTIIKTPLLVLWGANGVVGNLWDVLAGWQERAENVSGFGVPECGHFVPEEQPEIVLEAMCNFLTKYNEE